MYFGSVFMLFGTCVVGHVDRFLIDENKKRIRLKCFKWLFRPSQATPDSITVISFVHIILSVIFFIITTAAFIYSFFIDEDLAKTIFVIFCFATLFYMLWVCTVNDHYKKKAYIKKQKEEKSGIKRD